MYQAVLANIQIPRSCPAAPTVGFAGGEVFLVIPCQAGITSFPKSTYLVVHPPFRLAQWLQYAFAVVNDSHRTGETEFNRPAGYKQSFLRPRYAGSKYGVDIDGEICFFGEVYQFLIQDLETFLGNPVRLKVVDTDLQMIQPGLVQPPDPCLGEQVAVGDHPGDHTVPPYAGDDLLEVGVE